MMNQATSIIAEALLYSLLAGAASYIVLRVLLAILKNIPALIKYHLCNISLLIPLLIFILSLTKLTAVKNTAPVYPTPPPVTINYLQTQVTTPVQEPIAEEKNLTAEVVWTKVKNVMVEHSYTITWLYIAGLLLFSIRLLLQYLQSQQLKTKGLLPATDEWHRLLANTMQRLNISRPIHIAFTERKISPCIIGHAKAVILIPISLANHLSTEQAEAILLHELAHYKQYDHYINLGVQCVKCILFFNPFVWLSAKLIDKYRELSCDETAARHERNIELAETLALIAGMQARQNSLVMSLKKNNPLLTRVQALLSIRQYDKSSHRLLPAVVTTIILATGLLIAGSTQLFSTEKDNLREQLKEISAQMYKEGNHKYIFVDAVLDSLVTLPVGGDIFYMGNNHLFVGGKQLEGQLKMIYNEKLKTFLITQSEDGEHVVTLTAMPDKKKLTLADIINPSSDFRKCTAHDRYMANITTRAWRQVFNKLYNDKLIQSIADRFEMHYSQKGIVINGDTLRDDHDIKYRRLFKDVVGIDLNDNSVSGRMTIGDMKKYLVVDKSKESDTGWLAIDELLTNKLNDEMPQKEKFMFREMHREGLIDTNYKAIVVFTEEGIYANFVQLKGRQADKYIKMYLPKDLDVNNIQNRLTIYSTHNLEKDFPPGMNKDKMDKELMKRIDKIIAEHDQAVEEHDKAMKEHDRLMEEHDRLMKKHDRDMAKYDKQNTEYEKEILAILSDSLFNSGMQSFAIVDAIKDGYIKQDEPYKINYKAGKFWVDGADIPDNVAKKYETKLERFKKLHGHKVNMWGSIGSTVEGTVIDPEYVNQFGIMLPKPKKEEKEANVQTNKKTFKTSSVTLASGPFRVYNSKGSESQMKALVRSMHRDNILDSNSYHVIDYRQDAVYVNARKLTGGNASKYNAMLQTMGDKPGSGIIIEHVPQGVKIPDFYSGDTKIEINTSGNNLPAIAQLMFVDGNPNFILAHALRDGVLRERQNYTFQFSNGRAYLNGELLPAPYQLKYTKLMNDFMTAHKHEPKKYIIHGAGVTKKQLNTPESTIRKERINAGINEKGEYYVDRVIKMMAADGLIDTTQKHNMEYNARGIFVNGKKLSAEEAAKYEAILKAGYGRSPRWTASDGISYSNEP